MTLVKTDLRNTRESARELRVEPTAAIGGVITATNVQQALEQISTFTVPPNVTITTTPSTISPSVRDVFFNIATSAVITLPDAAAWKAANLTGEPLLLKDISGAASTNNITINRAGSNTIDGLTSILISMDYGAYSLRVTPSNNWITV